MSAADPTDRPAPPDTSVPTARKRFRRRQKLIRPALQIKIGVIFSFILITTLGFFAARLNLVIANHAGTRAEHIRDSFGEIVRSELLVSVALGIALAMAISVAVTFRIAGPVYRMCQFLKGVRKGTETEACRLRKGDAFGDLCALINEATEEQRERNAKTADSRSEPAVQSASSEERVEAEVSAT